MIDYKNTPEGKEVSRKYADILPLARPEPSPAHPRMSKLNRAKIFSPFAALRGYEEEIAAEGKEHLKIAKIELSKEDKGKLSDKLLQVRKGMEVTVCYFEAGDSQLTSLDISTEPAKSSAPLGSYRTFTGAVDRIDSVYRELIICTEERNQLGKELPVTVRFDDILELSGEGIIDIDEYLGILPDQEWPLCRSR